MRRKVGWSSVFLGEWDGAVCFYFLEGGVKQCILSRVGWSSVSLGGWGEAVYLK